MKNAIALALALMAAPLFACGGSDADTSTMPASTETVPAQAPESTDTNSTTPEQATTPTDPSQVPGNPEGQPTDPNTPTQPVNPNSPFAGLAALRTR